MCAKISLLGLCCGTENDATAVKCALLFPFPLSTILEIKLQSSSEKKGGKGESGLRNTFLIGFKELSPLIYIKIYFTVKSLPLSVELNIGRSPWTPPNSVCYWKKLRFGTHFQSKFWEVPSSSNYLFTGLSAHALSERPDSQQCQLAHGSTLQPQQGWLRALHPAGRLRSSRALSPVAGPWLPRAERPFPDLRGNWEHEPESSHHP